MLILEHNTSNSKTSKPDFVTFDGGDEWVWGGLDNQAFWLKIIEIYCKIGTLDKNRKLPLVSSVITVTAVVIISFVDIILTIIDRTSV